MGGIMSRYTGPRRRIVRRLGAELPGLTNETPGERAYPPGPHGQGRRKRPSEYAVRLFEKQKLRYNYGLTELQLRNYLTRAARMEGTTGANLLQLLERRLDNVVFRLGLAPTIPAARQLVRHSHILVDGRRTSSPAYEVRPGQKITVREKSRNHPHVAEGAAHGPALALPTYLERADDGLGGTCTGMPDRRDVPVQVDERMVVEFYAR
jgi:small subunit ribosomal protein S4